MTSGAAAVLVGLALLASLAGPAAATDAGCGDGTGRTAPTHPDSIRPNPGAGQAPLAVTMPDTQPALPSGMIEMDPSRTPSTGDADELEPNIDGEGARVR